MFRSVITIALACVFLAFPTLVQAQAKVKYFRKFDSDAHQFPVAYYAVDEKTALASPEWIYRLTVDTDGHLREVGFLHNGQLANTPDGYARYEVEGVVGDLQKPWKYTYYNAEGKALVTLLWLYASSEKGGKPDLLVRGTSAEDLRSMNLDEARRVVKKSVAKNMNQSFIYDERGFIKELRYLDDQGAPVLGSLGFSSKRFERDDQDNVTDSKAFDIAGNPMEVKGVFHATYKYDAEGHEIEAHYFAINGDEVSKPK